MVDTAPVNDQFHYIFILKLKYSSQYQESESRKQIRKIQNLVETWIQLILNPSLGRWESVQSFFRSLIKF